MRVNSTCFYLVVFTTAILLLSCSNASNENNQVTVSSNTPTPVLSESTLSLEAGLVYGTGDVKPAARTTFYLLDDSLAKILRSAGLQIPREYGEKGNDDSDFVLAYGRSVIYKDLKGYKDFYPPAVIALQPHIVQTVTTDFSGKAEFDVLKPGEYYLMGITPTPRAFVIWDLQIKLKPGKNRVTLDQNNAVAAY